MESWYHEIHHFVGKYVVFGQVGIQGDEEILVCLRIF